MNNLRSICLIICLSLMACFAYSQIHSTLGTMPNEPGKCYAKAYVPSVYATVHDSLYLYTGSDFDQEGIRMEEIETQQAGEKWVKKKDNNCRSANPDDCLVWCLIQVPSITETNYHVTDTTAITEYEIKVVEREVITQKLDIVDWVEVLCQKDITKTLVKNMRIALDDLGYDAGSLGKNKFDKKLKSALKKYQEDYNIVQGQLSIQSLEQLGLVY